MWHFNFSFHSLVAQVAKNPAMGETGSIPVLRSHGGGRISCSYSILCRFMDCIVHGQVRLNWATLLFHWLNIFLYPNVMTFPRYKVFKCRIYIWEVCWYLLDVVSGLIYVVFTSNILQDFSPLIFVEIVLWLNVWLSFLNCVVQINFISYEFFLLLKAYKYLTLL